MRLFYIVFISNRFIYLALYFVILLYYFIILYYSSYNLKKLNILRINFLEIFFFSKNILFSLSFSLKFIYSKFWITYIITLITLIT